MLFCRFLHDARGGKSIWQCDTADLRAYKRVRLHTKGPLQVSVATWRRSVAALDKWVRWSISVGLLAHEPFRYVDKTVLTPQGLKQVRVNAEQEPDAQAPPIRFVAFEDYLLWRDVGLRGELPDGRPDPCWRGRHGERNALFADVLVYTGMRLGEAASLLVTEVPPLTGHRITGEIRLSAAVTKRGKARSVYLNQRTLRSLHHHLEIERGELVARKHAHGTDAAQPGTLRVARTGRTGVHLVGGGRFWPHAKIGMQARQRLVGAGVDGAPAGPLWLWLGEDGRLMQPSSWQSIFRRANQRCARFDLALEVHAHTLRHCFAVQMLGLLLRQTLRALGEREDRRLTNAQLKRLLIGNPMRKLQLLLGHSQEATVYAYLDVLDEAQEIVLADWDAQAAALGRVATTPPTLGRTA
jgi:integrase